ncbi:MAG: hypothetical protein L6Q97_14720, partial [Thermoanaerobaculia bacterium]|nr:hypothetical protein [Thermoanaerobaculia bacterium]
RFSEREIRDFLLFSINFCIILSNQGKERYTSEALNLYRQGLEKGYLLKEGYLSHHTFINIVALGCTLKEFDWVKGFIKEYDNKVDPKPNLDRRDSVVLFCKARLQRDLGNYREAMQMLAQFQTDDPYYFLLAKVSLSRIYYELDEFDALESLLGTMRAYLKRNPLEERKKEHFQRQINLMYDLIKLVPADRHARARILTEIKKLPLVSDQNWFLKQIGTESSNR